MEEVAKVGLGYTNFAASDSSGCFIFTYPSSGFAVWDTTGNQLCGTPDLGNGTVALSANDHWLAAAPVGGGTDVIVWNAKLSCVPVALPLPRKLSNSTGLTVEQRGRKNRFHR